MISQTLDRNQGKRPGLFVEGIYAMPRLYGAQRMVLQTILDAQGETLAFIEDTRVAQVTQISLRDMRDWFLSLDQDEYVDLALTEGGLKASVTAKGRLALGLYRPFPTPTKPPTPEPARSRSRTGREKALVIGISDYPPPIRKLPAVANDVREMARLLGSDQGQFPAQNVRSLADGEATQKAILDVIEGTLSGAQADDAVFVYLAGHGEIAAGEYYFRPRHHRPGHHHQRRPPQEAQGGVRFLAQPAGVHVARLLS